MTTVTASRGFDLGQVVKDTFRALQANFGPFLLISILFGSLPALLNGWFTVHPVGGVGLKLLLSLVVMLMQIAGGAVLQASIVRGSVAFLDGEATAINDWITTGVAHWWPVFLVSIFVGVVIGAASMLLLVPGLMVATRWSVAMPVQVAENLPVMRSIGRSADLTKGRRWPVFGLMMLYFIPFIVLEFTLIGLLTGFQAGFAQAMQSTTTRLLFLPVFTALTAPIGSAGVAALYRELRVGREGTGAVSLAKVFD